MTLLLWGPTLSSTIKQSARVFYSDTKHVTIDLKKLQCVLMKYLHVCSQQLFGFVYCWQDSQVFNRDYVSVVNTQDVCRHILTQPLYWMIPLKLLPCSLIWMLGHDSVWEKMLLLYFSVCMFCHLAILYNTILTLILQRCPKLGPDLMSFALYPSKLSSESSA